MPIVGPIPHEGNVSFEGPPLSVRQVARMAESARGPKRDVRRTATDMRIVYASADVVRWDGSAEHPGEWRKDMKFAPRRTPNGHEASKWHASK